MEEWKLKAPLRQEVVFSILNVRAWIVTSLPRAFLYEVLISHLMDGRTILSIASRKSNLVVLVLNAEILDVDNNPFQNEDLTDSNMDDASEDHNLIDHNGDDNDADDDDIEIV